MARQNKCDTNTTTLGLKQPFVNKISFRLLVYKLQLETLPVPKINSGPNGVPLTQINFSGFAGAIQKQLFKGFMSSIEAATRKFSKN